MSPTTQTVIALLIVAICVALLIRWCSQWFWAADASHGCAGGGCRKCPSNSSENRLVHGGPSEEKIVSLGNVSVGFDDTADE